jgi:DivIVA domain-containing protein
MPLTPAEVHNVAFKKPPIGKRGYDEEEVDAFLDIVEVELARLIEENNDLRGRGGAAPVAAEQGDGASAAELAAAREDNQRLQAHIAELEQALSQGKDGAQQQVVALQQQLAQTEQQLAENRQQLEEAQRAAAEAQRAAKEADERAAAAGPSDAPAQLPTAEQHAQAVQVLALAQQTADQHLAKAKSEAERLVSEAQAHAHSTVTDAQEKSAKHVSDAEARAKQLDTDSSARAAQTVQDAEQRAATITAQFEQRKAALERRVEELRVYEREYRSRLRSYLESQLRDLDASGKADPAGEQAAPGQGAERAPAQQ